MSAFATTAVHGGAGGPDSRGALRKREYDSVAFEIESSQDLAHAYSRITNPTVEARGQRVAGFRVLWEFLPYLRVWRLLPIRFFHLPNPVRMLSR